MALNFPIASGFLDDKYGNGTITDRYLNRNVGLEITSADVTIDSSFVTMVKDHYNINHDNDDTQIERNISTALQTIERYTCRAIIQRQFTARWKRTKNIIVLPFPEHVSITSVKSIDEEGNETTLALNTDYYSYGDKEKWLEVGSNAYDQLEVVYTAGYGATLSATPTSLQDAIIYQMGVLYSNFDEGMGTTVYDRGERMDERAISACKGYIYYGGS